MRRLLSLALFTALSILTHADDGYRLWLRYDPIADVTLRESYAAAARHIVLATPTGTDSPTHTAARDELTAALPGLLGPTSVASVSLEKSPAPAAVGDEGFSLSLRGTDTIVIAAARDVGVLYGAFALLRHFQTHRPLASLAHTSSPKISRRLLNHWDNLDRSVERGYAGKSLWEWDKLPAELSPRYRDYARANASLGLNGVVPVNVNANAQFLTAPYLAKFAAIRCRCSNGSSSSTRNPAASISSTW